jgi:protein-tyrosine-phosphatase
MNLATVEADIAAAQLIVNLTGIHGPALFRENVGAPIEDWEVTDPYGDEMDVYRRVCDEIEGRILELAARLRSEMQRRMHA